MADKMLDLKECSKPILHPSPRSLLELASIKMAFNVWLEKFNRSFGPVEKSSYIDIIELEVDAKILTHVPSMIKKSIEVWLLPMARLLSEWVFYCRGVLDNFKFDQIYNRFNLIAFGGNGRVHFKDTVTNFLMDDSLNNTIKFEMACVHCFEEKIDSLWPLVNNTLNVDCLQFDKNFMLYYWIYLKTGQLSQIPLQGFSCIERLMISKCFEKKMYSAVEYFLTLLNPDDRLAEIGEFFESAGDEPSYRHLLPILDDTLQREILNKYKFCILTALVTNYEPIEYSVQCWLYIRDLITPEIYYDEIISYVFKYRNSDGITDRDEAFWLKHLEITLEQIWLNTPQHLKESTLELHLGDILDYYNAFDNYSDCDFLINFGQDIRLLLAILSDADVDSRKSFWDESWSTWFEGVSVSQFEEFMKMCLIDTEDVEDFKRTLPSTVEFRNYHNTLSRLGYCNELDEIISWLYSNQERNEILAIEKKFLPERIFLQQPAVWDKYLKYIDTLFPSHDLASDFKDELMLSDDVLALLLSERIAYNKFRDVEIAVSMFASVEKHVEIKLKISQLFYNRISTGFVYPFDKTLWNEFLKWCFENQTLVDDFIKSFQIDVIFEAALSHCVQYLYPENFDNSHHQYLLDPWFVAVNEFLVWYFKSNSLSENFIRDRVRYYEEMDVAEFERIIRKDKRSVIRKMKIKLLNEEEHAEH